MKGSFGEKGWEIRICAFPTPAFPADGGILRPAPNPYILYSLSMLYDSIATNRPFSASFGHFEDKIPK
jgi:hypothetical protein